MTISRTFGGAGADYVDVNAAINARVAAGAFTDDETWTITGSHDCVTINTHADIVLGTHSLTIRCPKEAGKYHYGSFTKGYVMTVKAPIWLVVSANSTGQLLFENFNISADNDGTDPAWSPVTGNTQFGYAVVIAQQVGGVNPPTLPFSRIDVKNIVIRNVGANSPGGIWVFANKRGSFGSITPAQDVYVDGIKGYNLICTLACICQNSEGSEDPEKLQMRNVVSYNHLNSFTATGIRCFIAFKATNCVACHDNVNTHPDWDLWSSYADHCADSDGSLVTEGGTNNVTPIVPSDAFESVAVADDDFLFLDVGSVSAESSTDPLPGKAPLDVSFGASVVFSPSDSVLAESGIAGGLSKDIADQDRPGTDGKYSIGAHEQTYTYPSGTVLS